MRLILHIGMPKAGSSALQTALAAARRPLRERGVLYPKGALNQNFLIAGIAPPDRLGRLYAQQYGDDHAAIHRDFTAFWDGIRAEIDQRSPETVILSGELLFGPFGDQGPEPVRALLAPLGAQLEIVAYLRRPSDYYLSMAQQRLKASWQIRPVAPIHYRKSLESARAAADILHAIPYERDRFPDGDVVADFAARLLPEARDVLAAVDDPKVKPSMSAEAMAIVQEYRKRRHPDGNNRFTRDTGLVIRHLAAEEAALGGKRRPVLRPEIRQIVDGASVDLLWLRDELGVRFDDIDYDTIGPPPELAVSRVEDICVVDAERKATLEATLAGLELPSSDAGRKTFRASVPRQRKPVSGKDAPRKRWRLPWR